MLRRIQTFFLTYQGLKVKNAIIGVGASLVLLGALFKIMHWPGAGLMLTIGMCTEAFIFFFQGVILPPHKDYHWEKVFPGVDIAPEVEEELELEGIKPEQPGVSPIQALLQQPQVSPEVLDRLKEAIHRIGETMEQLKDITEAGAASKEFAEKTREVAALMGEMEKAYSEAVNSIQELAQAGQITREYREGMEQLSGAIKELSQIYPTEAEVVKERLEVQKSLATAAKEAEESMRNIAATASSLSESFRKIDENFSAIAADGEAFAQLRNKIDRLSEDLEQVVQATSQYREGMTRLAEYISTLNRIYGNMVSALGLKPQE